MLPLEGLRVLDLSRVLAGPYATMALADLGADVLKIEHPERGDDTRHWGPPFAGGESAYFLSVNRNKKSVGVDLKTDEGLKKVTRLAAGADVVIENWKRGALESMGLGYESLKGENPGLVYCSITGFGPGPDEDRPGYDFLVQARAGIMGITGQPGGEPTKVGVAAADIYIIENLTLEELAASGHHEFEFVCLPLKLVGATGSPVRPVARVSGVG